MYIRNRQKGHWITILKIILVISLINYTFNNQGKMNFRFMTLKNGKGQIFENINSILYCFFTLLILV